MITTVRHTGIVVTNLEKSLAFYRDALGFGKVVRDVEVNGAFFDTLTDLSDVRIHIAMLETDDGSRLELLQYLSHPGSSLTKNESCTVGCSHVALEVDDIEQTYQQLLEKGIRFHAPPQLDPHGSSKVAYCRDPDGAIVELVEVIDAGRSPYTPR